MLVTALPEYRRRRGWSQREVARRCGLSRAEVSAIETGRVVPSTAAALALARAFDCSVEGLFGLQETAARTWAWPPKHRAGRFWEARVGDRTLVFPNESTTVGTLPSDGVYEGGGREVTRPSDPNRTLVIAGCDPAVSLLVARIGAMSDLRVIPLTRSSQRSVELLEQGLVHVAGVHLYGEPGQDENFTAARALLGERFRLLRLARWDEGVALDSSLKLGSIKAALASNLRWVGREAGSGARQCLDHILGRRRKPEGYQYHAGDHHGVSEAISAGWAQAGVCVRLPAEERGLQFFKVREENYDLCFLAEEEGDPRLQALLTAVRSVSYEKDLQQLPGYHTENTGELH